MRDLATAALLLAGSLFMFLAALGVARMPDLFTRMQTATKATTLGIGCMLIALALHFGSLGIAARAMAAVLFVVLTAPVAAHVIGRAAYDAGEPLWEKTVADELGRPRDRGEPPRDRMPREAEVAAPHGS